jgi:hypothetical protein
MSDFPDNFFEVLGVEEGHAAMWVLHEAAIESALSQAQASQAYACAQ